MLTASITEPISWIRCLFQQVFFRGLVRNGWTAPHHDYKASTTTTGPDPTPEFKDVGWHTSEPMLCYKIPLHRICTRNITYYNCNICSGIEIAYTTSSTCSNYRTYQWWQHYIQLNANRIGNNLTALGVLLELKGQYRGGTGVKDIIQIQEPLNPELHHIIDR